MARSRSAACGLLYLFLLTTAVVNAFGTGHLITSSSGTAATLLSHSTRSSSWTGNSTRSSNGTNLSRRPYSRPSAGGGGSVGTTSTSIATTTSKSSSRIFSVHGTSYTGNSTRSADGTDVSRRPFMRPSAGSGGLKSPPATVGTTSVRIATTSSESSSSKFTVRGTSWTGNSTGSADGGDPSRIPFIQPSVGFGGPKGPPGNKDTYTFGPDATTTSESLTITMGPTTQPPSATVPSASSCASPVYSSGSVVMCDPVYDSTTSLRYDEFSYFQPTGTSSAIPPFGWYTAQPGDHNDDDHPVLFPIIWGMVFPKFPVIIGGFGVIFPPEFKIPTISLPKCFHFLFINTCPKTDIPKFISKPGGPFPPPDIPPGPPPPYPGDEEPPPYDEEAEKDKEDEENKSKSTNDEKTKSPNNSASKESKSSPSTTSDAKTTSHSSITTSRSIVTSSRSSSSWNSTSFRSSTSRASTSSTRSCRRSTTTPLPPASTDLNGEACLLLPPEYNPAYGSMPLVAPSEATFIVSSLPSMPTQSSSSRSYDECDDGLADIYDPTYTGIYQPPPDPTGPVINPFSFSQPTWTPSPRGDAKSVSSSKMKSSDVSSSSSSSSSKKPPDPTSSSKKPPDPPTSTKPPPAPSPTFIGQNGDNSWAKNLDWNGDGSFWCGQHVLTLDAAKAVVKEFKPGVMYFQYSSHYETQPNSDGYSKNLLYFTCSSDAAYGQGYDGEQLQIFFNYFLSKRDSNNPCGSQNIPLPPGKKKRDLLDWASETEANLTSPLDQRDSEYDSPPAQSSGQVQGLQRRDDTCRVTVNMCHDCTTTIPCGEVADTTTPVNCYGDRPAKWPKRTCTLQPQYTSGRFPQLIDVKCKCDDGTSPPSWKEGTTYKCPDMKPKRKVRRGGEVEEEDDDEVLEAGEKARRGEISEAETKTRKRRLAKRRRRVAKEERMQEQGVKRRKKRERLRSKMGGSDST